MVGINHIHEKQLKFNKMKELELEFVTFKSA